ncbi:MAG: monovalent cation/H+ antiporter complex subunit F [Bacillota bacterium]
MTDRLFFFFIAVLGLLSFLSMYRAVVGPRTEDRLVAINVMTTKTILIIVLIASMTRSYTYLDVALVYALCSFIVTIAVLKGIKKGRLY